LIHVLAKQLPLPPGFPGLQTWSYHYQEAFPTACAGSSTHTGTYSQEFARALEVDSSLLELLLTPRATIINEESSLTESLSMNLALSNCMALPSASHTVFILMHDSICIS
jgi:hypothetical protein